MFLSLPHTFPGSSWDFAEIQGPDKNPDNRSLWKI